MAQRKAVSGWGNGHTKPLDGTVISRFDRPKSDTPTRIAVISDPHLSVDSTGTEKMFHKTEERLREAVRMVNSRDPDTTLITGDVTKDGEPWNFERFDEIAGNLNTSVIATPGEHDVLKSWDEHDTLSVTDFEKLYSPGSYPAIQRVGGVDLIVLNSASLPDGSLRDSERGAVSSAQLIKLDFVLRRAENPVVALHHTMKPVPRDFERGTLNESCMLRNCDELTWILRKHDVPMVISGHRHIPETVEYEHLTQVVAPSTCSYPQAHLIVDIDVDGTSLKMVPHASKTEQLEAREALLTEKASNSELGVVRSIDEEVLNDVAPPGRAE